MGKRQRRDRKACHVEIGTKERDRGEVEIGVTLRQ